MEAYDPKTDAWVSMEELPQGRGPVATAVVANQLFALGGDNCSGVVWTPPSPDVAAPSPLPLAELRTLGFNEKVSKVKYILDSLRDKGPPSHRNFIYVFLYDSMR